MRHTPDPITLGLAPGPVTGWMDNVNLEREQASARPRTRTTDAARPTSQRLTEPMRLCLEPTLDLGLDSHAGASRNCYPSGIEPSVLNDRRVGTERFLGRHASAWQSQQRKLLRPDPARLFGAARLERDTVAKNHPGAACE